MTKLGTITAIVLLAACGSGNKTDFAGTYQVVEHTINDTDCAEQGSAVNDYSHFRLRRDQFLGQELLSFGACESADPKTCNDFGVLGGFFEVGGQWITKSSESSGGGSLPCALGHSRSTIIETGPGQIRIEIRHYSDIDQNVSAAQCTPDEASARNVDMACQQFEVLMGSIQH